MPKAPWLLGVLMLFDSWDSVVIAYTLPVLLGQWGLSALQAGWLASAGYAGQFLGAIIFGSLAERHGRLPVLKALVLVMCLLALACALAANYEQLITLRALQGLAIGGALPVAICYINEVRADGDPRALFGTFQFLMTSGFGLAALSGVWLIPAFGWRIMFGSVRCRSSCCLHATVARITALARRTGPRGRGGTVTRAAGLRPAPCGRCRGTYPRKRREGACCNAVRA